MLCSLDTHDIFRAYRFLPIKGAIPNFLLLLPHFEIFLYMPMTLAIIKNK